MTVKLVNDPRYPRLEMTQTVYAVCCIGEDGSEVTHLFSTVEKREAWANRDERIHVFYDHVLDDPDHHEKPLSKAN